MVPLSFSQTGKDVWLLSEAVEVLCAKKAFIVKRIGHLPTPDPDKVLCGQVTWSVHGGPASAWDVAKMRANFVN